MLIIKLKIIFFSIPYTQGIFQSIGLKEFHSYLTLEDKSGTEGKNHLEQGLALLKLATKRYARKQIKWIRGRFLRTSTRQVTTFILKIDNFVIKYFENSSYYQKL